MNNKLKLLKQILNISDETIRQNKKFFTNLFNIDKTQIAEFLNSDNIDDKVFVATKGKYEHYNDIPYSFELGADIQIDLSNSSGELLDEGNCIIFGDVYGYYKNVKTRDNAYIGRSELIFKNNKTENYLQLNDFCEYLNSLSNKQEYVNFYDYALTKLFLFKLDDKSTEDNKTTYNLIIIELLNQYNVGSRLDLIITDNEPNSDKINITLNPYNGGL